MRAILLAIVLVGVPFTGIAFANLLEVKKAVEEAHCKKLATSYASSPSSFTVPAIAQLQICLAETLKSNEPMTTRRNLDIEAPSSSTNTIDTMHPTPPTLPTPPAAINIQ